MNMVELFEAALETKVKQLVDVKIAVLLERVINLENETIELKKQIVDLEQTTPSIDDITTMIEKNGYVTEQDVDCMIESANQAVESDFDDRVIAALRNAL